MEHLSEKQLDSKLIFDGHILRIELDTVELEDGTTASREVVRHPGGVCVLAVTEQEEILLVRQLRYPYQEVTAEVPAGKLDYGEDPETGARRELLEECGCTPDSFTYLGRLYPSPGYTSEIIRIYLAKGLHFTEQSLDADEFLDVERVPFEEALRRVMHDELPDSKTQIAILKYAAMKAQA